MGLNLTNFVSITFTMVEENFVKIHLRRCSRMVLNLTNFVRITSIMVESFFENSPSEMLQNGPQSK